MFFMLPERRAYSRRFVHPSVPPGRCQVHSKISISVEFHIMRLMSVYSVIVGLILHCGVKKDQRKIKGITLYRPSHKYIRPSVTLLSRAYL